MKLFEFGIVFVVLSWVVVIIVNVAFAVGVYHSSLELRHKTRLVPQAIWVMATLFGGVVTAGFYWLIHHSTLSQNTQEIELEVERPISIFNTDEH